jgi:hypothetical protein
MHILFDRLVSSFFNMRIQTCLIILFLSFFSSSKAQKVAFFENVEFDSSTSIVCFPSKSNPEQYSFIINTQADFNQLKKDWVFEKKDFGKKPDNSLSIYVVKNKNGEWIGTIYPGINKITSIRASYEFDNARLISAAKKHPFHFQVKHETFNNRDEYLKQYNKAVLEKNYLFSVGPGRWDGTFKIIIPSSDSINTPVAAIHALESKFKTFTDSANYDLGYELRDDNMDYKKSFKITVDCLQSVYDNYNDPVFKKTDWKPNPMFMNSFWKK